MSRRLKYSRLVELVCVTKNIKHRKCLHKVMRVHTHDFIQNSFPFLILKV